MFTKHGSRVEAEAAALVAAAHHGVVELVDAVDGVLRTRWVEGRPLAAVGPLPVQEIAGLTAAVASTLADLHDRGVVHGGIDATHVLVTAEGRPVLCSFGRGGSPPGDVASLGSVVAALLETAPPSASQAAGRPGRARPLGPMLAPLAARALADLAAATQAPDPGNRPTARALAASITEQVPDARLPRPPAPSLLPVPRPASRPVPAARAGAAAGTAAVLALVAWALVAGPLAGRPTPAVPAQARGADPLPGRPAATAPTTTVAPPSPTTTLTGPALASRVWPKEPLDFHDGVLTTGDGARYLVGQPGDAALAGDWACTGSPTVALLRPATGEVYAFDDWADHGRDVVARPVGRVPGATALAAADLDGDGCTDLLATAPGVAPVPVTGVRR